MSLTREITSNPVRRGQERVKLHQNQLNNQNLIPSRKLYPKNNFYSKINWYPNHQVQAKVMSTSLKQNLMENHQIHRKKRQQPMHSKSNLKKSILINSRIKKIIHLLKQANKNYLKKVTRISFISMSKTNLKNDHLIKNFI